VAQADRTPAELAAELIAADRPSEPPDDQPPPNAAVGLLGLLAYPWLRRHRRQLMPIAVVAVVALVALLVLTLLV
jgi:MYXO-CTERM domain-containing protein